MNGGKLNRGMGKSRGVSLLDAIKSNILSIKKVAHAMKIRIVRKIAKPRLICMRVLDNKMRFLSEIERKTKDKIGNEFFRDKLRIILLKTTIKYGQLMLLQYLLRM